jgi:hypothetical protein
MKSEIAEKSKEILSIEQQSAAALRKITSIQLGISEESTSNIKEYIQDQKSSSKLALEAVEKERLAKLRAEEENIQLMKDASAFDKEAQNNVNIIIGQINKEAGLKKVLIEDTERLNILEAGRVKSLYDVYSQMKDIADVQREILQNEIDLAAKTGERVRDLNKAKREAAGVVLTPAQERAEAIDLARDNLLSAIREKDIKFEVIDAEINLIKIKTELEREQAKVAYLAAKEAGATVELLNAYKGLITAQDKMLGRKTSDAFFTGQPETSEGTVMGEKNIPGTLDVWAASRKRGAQSVVDGAENELNIAKLEKTLSPFMVLMNNMKASSKEIGDTWSTDDGIGYKISASILAAQVPLNDMIAKFKELGPEGQIMVALIEGTQSISMAFQDMSAVLSDTNSTFSDKFVAMAGVVSSVLSTIQQVTKASSDAKIASIDKEIAAEQKRDGKSAESVARIQALEKKKDAAAKKAFEVNKKLQIAQAVVSTAAGMVGIAASLASLPFGVGIPLIPAAMAMFGALGAAQIAIIAGTSYQSSASSAASAATPSALSVGSRSSSVDLARSNTNIGGEHGYLTGAQGQGTGASNFKPRAYGGYGNAGMIVGEKGPELFVPSTPGTVVSNDNMTQAAPINANISINAIDAEGVERVLTDQRGHIIGMLREAANANGQNFLENVDTIKYRRTGGRRL